MPPDQCQEHSGLTARISDLCDKVDRVLNRLEDGDRRIGSLEKWRAGLAGGLAVLSLMIVGILIPIVAAFIR